MKTLQFCFFFWALLLINFAGGAAFPTLAETRSGPGPGDPRITAAIASRNRLNAALVTGDLATAGTLFASDFVVNSPINRVVDRANVLGRRTLERNSARGNRPEHRICRRARRICGADG